MRTITQEQEELRRHWLTVSAVGMAAVVNAASWAVLLWKIPYVSEPILLHYNVYFGIDLTGPWAQMFWIPGSALLVGVIHSAIVWMVPLNHRIIAWILLVMSIIIQAMALLASLLVVLLNSSL